MTCGSLSTCVFHTVLNFADADKILTLIRAYILYECVDVCVILIGEQGYSDVALLFIAKIKACIFDDACGMINVSVKN